MRTAEEIKKEIEESMSCGEPFFKIETLLNELHSIGNSEILNKLENIIKDNYDHSDHGHEYWFTGNFDDTFEMGVKTGTRDTLYMIGVELGLELQKPEQKEVEI